MGSWGRGGGGGQASIVNTLDLKDSLPEDISNQLWIWIKMQLFHLFSLGDRCSLELTLLSISPAQQPSLSPYEFNGIKSVELAKLELSLPPPQFKHTTDYTNPECQPTNFFRCV